MKTRLLHILLFALASFTFVSCEDDSTEGLTRITYYPQFELEGDKMMLVSLGSSFTDPGVYAYEGEEDRSADVTSVITNSAGAVLSAINTNAVDLYTITYSVVNKDGIAGSTTRTVAVYDPSVTTNIAGAYTLAAGSYRVNLSSGAQTPYSGFSVTISEVAPGIYYTTDYMAGFYEKGYGYGSNYAMKGYFKLNGDNTLDIITGNVAGWGDSYDDFSEGVYNPEDGSISYVLLYAGTLQFHITLTK